MAENKRKILEEINIELQWREYLKRVDLVESELHSKQRTEMKRAFYGACGQMLILWLRASVELTDEEFVIVLEDVRNQVRKFWDDEVRKGGH